MIDPHPSVKQGIGSHDFYTPIATTNSFVEVPYIDDSGIQFTCIGQIIANDGGGKDAELSFDGTTVHGLILKGEVLTFDKRRNRSIYVKSAAAGQPTNLRIFAW